MIVLDMVMNLLIDSCPSYKERSENYMKENYEEGEERLLYMEMSDLAEHIVAMYKNNQTDEFDKLFETIELLHTDGDRDVRVLASVGLLEDIQNHILRDEKLTLSAFETHLGSVSLEWWTHLINAWEGKSDYFGGPIKN
ncbi:iron-sulfur cluster repair protein YtfE (RIC family) [Paenibacillus amylolyticus]|uniref:Iron-sulfur cluster repair protein YtfE (RIC family) n=1 Tax=Paenibacillus amylolyticus TaxID=1451 RepID=A0AAP5H1T5_PAEAM|nr:hypothetical protein [Paenibacillus amylolyticus]MDR6724262.1 iron-sulfur cluster repair protein YtfE (RIC family) [Paenibacillus amylolyticus]